MADAGLLYGSLELARRINSTEPLANLAESPAMPERIAQIAFPPGGWGTWRRSTPVASSYSNGSTIAGNRTNGLCIWTQHVLSSFVRLREFPEDLEVSAAQMETNHAQLKWLADEAARRKIRIIWQTYVITLSAKFQAAHRPELAGPGGLELAQRYTSAWIEQFLADSPGMSLMVTPAEGGFQSAAAGHPRGVRSGVLRDIIFPSSPALDSGVA